MSLNMSLEKQCLLSISLLPEFGWSIKDQPVYGPGSVFQGTVKLKILSRVPNIEKIKLTFRAYECIPPFEVSPGVLRKTKNGLFAVQWTLWNSKRHALTKTLDANAEYSFPFTIQMPLLQLPPSANHAVYQCKYQLVASVESSRDTASSVENNIQTIKDVLYMPYIETKLLKKISLFDARKGDMSVQAEVSSYDYVPNDYIRITVRVSSFKSNNRSQLPYATIQVKLIRIIHVDAFKEIKDQTETVTTVTHKLLLIGCPTENDCNHNNQQMYCCKANFSIHIPADITPTVDYGRLAQIHYRLQINVQQKGPLGGIWNYNTTLEDIPITIGTLGYGISVSTDLKVYSNYYSSPVSSHSANYCVPDSNMPNPTFMKAIEYEDALPLYEPHRLPTYSASQMAA